MRRIPGALRFAEDRILVEQLRLLLTSVVSSTIPVVVLSTLMLITLSRAENALALGVWYLLVVGSKLASLYVARRYLKTAIPLSHARRVAWSMIGFYAFNGLAWGSLPWLTLDTASDAGRVIVLALMAGVIGSAMAQTSSVLAVFLAFAFTTLTPVAIKLLQLDEPAYTAFAAATVLYFLSLLSLARNNTEAALAAIRLRFENSQLLDQLRIESELADAARREAEAANMAKSRFLAAASHDLRQPIHSQGLFLNVLSGTSLNEQQQELVDNIRRSSEASREMLSTLLDFSRIEAGVIRPRSQDFRLQPLLNKLEVELGPLADAKGLLYRSRESALAVHSDPALLELILRNLISNAIRYTDKGGLLVAARRRGGEAVIEVWDTGVGIAEEQQREVFREFLQLGNPERDSRKGLGLGLAIVDGLAGTLGHRLSLASAPGRGSVFRLAVPQADGVVLDELEVSSERRSESLRGRVLVIDDEESVRSGMLHLLRDWGCECRAAEGIAEALAIVQQWPPQLIISDYRLREQHTGSEAIARVRESLGTEIPALLITGDTAPERIREAEASGVPLLHKPVSPAHLYHLLVTALDGQDTASGPLSVCTHP
jgi:signal transduction histidine kinase/ActR/RegA family two-component response regulator